MSPATKPPRRRRRPTLPARPVKPDPIWITTSYGSLRLGATYSNQVQVDGELWVNNATHSVSCSLYRRDERSPFHLGKDHDDPRSAEERVSEIRVWRPRERTDPSISARRKAAVAIDQAVNEWAATQEAPAIMRAAARFEKANDVWSFAFLVGEHQTRERKARQDRLEAARALGEVEAPRGPRFSPLSPAHAFHVLTSRLFKVIADLERDPREGLDVEGTRMRLTALAGLSRPSGGRAEDPELWDAMTALLELLDE